MRKRSKLIAVLVVALLVCGCTASQFRKSAIIIRDYAVTLDKVQDGFIQANKDGFLDDAGLKEINSYLVEAARDGKAAVAAIRLAKSKPGALAAIDAALASTDTLLNQGLLHVKNPQAKTSLQALILSLRGLLATAKALLA